MMRRGGQPSSFGAVGGASTSAANNKSAQQYGKGFLLGAVAGWCFHYLMSSGTAAVLLVHPHQPDAYYGGLRSLSVQSNIYPHHPVDEEVAVNHEEAQSGQDDEEREHAEGAGELLDDGNTHNEEDGGGGTLDDSPHQRSPADRTESKQPNTQYNKTFTELVKASGSDKYHRHHYERYYTSWLEPYRHRPNLKILEIGARGGRSLTLWDSYFTDASLILGLAYRAGTDRLPERLVNMRHNVSVHFGDQSLRETMQALLEYGPFDVIIDDGSHVPQHVLFSLFSLWDRAVVPGGLYVIEDIETSYWKNGSKIYGYPLIGTGIGAAPEHSVVTKLEQIQQVLFRYQIGARQLVNLMPGDQNICSVEWGMNLAALRKCDGDNTEFDKPPMQPIIYDEDQMSAWIQEARRTNPKGYLGEKKLESKLMRLQLSHHETKTG